MAEETDGVGETFDDSLRIALTVASQFGERVARFREQSARDREAAATQEGRELAARFESERGAMRAELAPVRRPEWWDRATPQDIGQVYETATAWRDFDDVAEGAGDLIRREVQERYGIDVDAFTVDGKSALSAIAEADRVRADAAAERAKAGEELTAVQLLFAQVDGREQDTEDHRSSTDEALAGELDGYDFIPDPNGFDASWHDPFAVPPPVDEDRPGDTPEKRSQLYDSAERRREFARALEAQRVPEKTIAARLLADGENARHPREAVASSAGKASRVRGKGSGAVQQRARGGLSR